jgi:arsenate reductase-like glutaredoxin family protein
MNSCDSIRQFLAWTDACKNDYDEAVALKERASSEIDDIIKKLQVDPPGYRERAKLATELSALLAARQKAAFAEAILWESLSWIEGHRSAIRSLRARLESIEQIIEESRSDEFHPATNIIEETLGGAGT